MPDFINNIINLIRVDNYLKNTFVFLPLFFKGQLFEIDKFLSACVGFLAFSFVASSIYIINDMFDVEFDRKHPIKKFRPLASGSISIQLARFIALGMISLGLSFAFFLNVNVLIVLIIYAIMNLLYSYKLKHIPVVDISIIAIGFILRLWAGSFATDILLSKWIILLTFLLALFLALAKRRDDVLLYLNNSEKTRKSIDGYNLPFIDGAMFVISAVAIVSYIMYVSSDDVLNRINSPYLYVSSIFVIIGFLRYLQIAIVEKKSGSPVKILSGDLFIQIILFIWIIFFGLVLY
jgi:decaprenyl-phosphate phosphoribosyltransferase